MTDRLKRIVTYTILLGIFLGISTTGVVADGTEQLGDPSITIAQGSGIVLAGTGLETTQPGTISITVPVRTTIQQVLLYWSGGAYSTDPDVLTQGDDTITVAANSVTNSVTGTLIGGPLNFFYYGLFGLNGYMDFSTYRADITGLGIVQPGANTIEIKDMDFTVPSNSGNYNENNGAGILVIYDDGSTSSLIQLRDGIDLAFINFWAERCCTVPQTFEFDPASVDRVANLGMFFGSVSQDRPNSIELTVAVGGGTTNLSNLLESNNGPQWDTLNLDIHIPAGATSLTVQAFSRNDTGDGQDPLAASFTWSAAALSVPIPPASIGDRVWIDANNNGIQDDGESGYSGATVSLQTCAGAAMGTTTTDTAGIYSFTGLIPGSYKVIFTLPGGNVFSPMDANANVDDAVDSDADTTTGITACTDLAPGENDITWDAGLVPKASIGDRVWIDANNNGIQDAGESGYSGATVSLQNCAGAAMGTTTTDATGIYSFTGLLPGSYKVIFTLPTGYIFSPQNQGGDVAKDSDADITTGLTMCTSLSPRENDMTWDAGIYKMMAPGTGTPGYWKNHPEAWPENSITIGGITYTKAQAIAIIENSVKGDKTYTMFPALVAAKLNVVIGNDPSCIIDTISAADAWMAIHIVGTQVEGSSQAWKDGEPLYIKMDDYNNGLLCAPHRD